MVAGVGAGHDDVAALHQPQVRRRSFAERGLGDLVHEGTGGVHYRLGLHHTLAVGPAQRRDPMVGLALQRGAFGSRPHLRAALFRIHCGKDDKAGILHPAIGIFETAGQVILQDRAMRRIAQVDLVRARQRLSPAKAVVKE